GRVAAARRQIHRETVLEGAALALHGAVQLLLQIFAFISLQRSWCRTDARARAAFWNALAGADAIERGRAELRRGVSTRSLVRGRLRLRMRRGLGGVVRRRGRCAAARRWVAVEPLPSDHDHLLRAAAPRQK